MSGFVTDKEIEKKEEVTIAVGNWIINELKNTSSVETESILPEVLKSFFNNFSN